MPVYNFDDINSIPAKDIQFTINNHLFLDVLLMEFRGTAISWSSHKNKLKNILREQELSSVCLFDLILYVHSTIFQLCGRNYHLT